MDNPSYRVVRIEGSAPPSEQEAEARLRQEGYEPFRWYDVPGMKYPPHRHDQDECIWILQGELTLSLDGQDVTLKPGDRIYLPARIRHAAVANNKGVTYLVGRRA